MRVHAHVRDFRTTISITKTGAGVYSTSTETTKNHKNYKNYPEYGNYENYDGGLLDCEGGIATNRCMSMYVHVNFSWEMY